MYNELSDIVLIAPVISDADYWTNDEAIVGESIQLDLKNPSVKDTVFGVNVSINGNGERWQNIFLDVNSAQLYLLTPFTSKPKTFQKSQPHRYLSKGDIYSHEGVDKKSTRQTSATHTANESGGSITMINSPLRSNHKRLPSVIMGSNGEHRSTNGGRIQRVIDLLDLQQVHVDRIDLHLVSLYFDDAVRTSFIFRFRSFERRSRFLMLVADVSQRMRNGHGWSAEAEPTDSVFPAAAYKFPVPLEGGKGSRADGVAEPPSPPKGSRKIEAAARPAKRSKVLKRQNSRDKIKMKRGTQMMQGKRTSRKSMMPSGKASVASRRPLGEDSNSKRMQKK
jgi:hypothetical protein